MSSAPSSSSSSSSSTTSKPTLTDKDLWGEKDAVLSEIESQIASLTDAQLENRIRMYEGNIRAMSNEVKRLTEEQKKAQEKIKDNNEKIKMNKQLPYLVSNVIEVSSSRSSFSFLLSLIGSLLLFHHHLDSGL
jgi:ATP-dependent 26S proteasome regulatory subunit